MLLKFNIYNSHQIKIKNRGKFMKIFKSYNRNYYIEIIIKIRNPK